MDTEKKIEKYVKPKGLGIRHLQTAMLTLGMVLVYFFRVNMSMAIVAMTDSDNEQSFNWSMQTQSVILSSFFWGYIMLQIPGGELAARFGGSVLFTIAIGVNATVTLLIPLVTFYGGWQATCACRVLQGLVQGFVYPSINNLLGKWAPLDEKSRIGTVIYAGAHLGSAVQLMASGFIADWWGWPAIFYVDGALGALWTVMYVFLGADSPGTSKMISEEEKLYIQSSLGHVGEAKKLKTPWKSIFTSTAFIALIIVHSCQGWGYWTLMTEMPSYFKLVLGVDIKSSGMMSALPYLAMYLLSIPIGIVSDYVLAKKYLSISTTRKLVNSIGLYGPAIALIGLTYAPAGNVAVAVVLLTVIVGLNAGHLSGLMITHIDMAPNFAGTMMGITNCIANIVSLIAPLVAGAILKDETDPQEWKMVFYVSSALYVIGNTIYVVFGTNERQKWDDYGTGDESGTKVEKERAV